MESKCLVLFFLSTCLLLPCWAHSEGFRICFRQIDNSSQFQGIFSTCSGYSQTNPTWSSPFRDDTGGRSGGHKYQWRVEAGDQIQKYKENRLCFRETEGSSQCQRTRKSCTGWSSIATWTRPFRDYTNGETGGCRYSWLIQSRWYYSAPSRFQVCRVCFKESEGSSQCQGTRQSCSGWAAPGADPSWTLPFHDNTDKRNGGCTYNWYLDCTSMYYAVFCPRDSPCKRY